MGSQRLHWISIVMVEFACLGHRIAREYSTTNKLINMIAQGEALGEPVGILLWHSCNICIALCPLPARRLTARVMSRACRHSCCLHDMPGGSHQRDTQSCDSQELGPRHINKYSANEQRQTFTE